MVSRRYAVMAVMTAALAAGCVGAGAPGAPGGPGAAGRNDVGPRCHQVFVADGAALDGFAASPAPVLTSASVPDGVFASNGAPRIYYVDGRPAAHGVWVAEPDGGGAWAARARVTLDGAVVADAVDPDIVVLPDGRFRMFYFHGWFASRVPSPEPDHPIYSAISDDGVHFTVEGLAISAPGVTDPSVVQLPDASWLMALAQPGAGGAVLLATSADGRAFTPIASNTPRGVPELALAPDGAAMLVVAEPGGFAAHLSRDGGRTWTRAPDLLLRSRAPINDPSLSRRPDGGWALVYKGFMDNC